MYLAIFDELIAFNFGFELVMINKEIVNAINFTRSCSASCE